MRNSPLVIALVCALAPVALPAAAQVPTPSPISGVPSPASTPTPAGPPLNLSLEEAVALGLRQNRTIRSAYLQRVVERFDLFVTERVFDPRGVISADVTRRRSADGEVVTDSVVAPSVSWRTPLGSSAGFVWERRDRLQGLGGAAEETTSLQLRQPLLRGAGVDVNMAPVRIARLQDDINRLQLKSTVSGAVSAIVFAYRGLVTAQEQVRLSELSLERARRLLETNRTLIDAGRMAAADIVQTESEVANQEVALLQARQQRATAQLQLLQLLAIEARTNIVASDAISVERVAVDLDQALTFAKENRVDVLAQRKSLEQMRHALVVARNNRLWDLSVVGSVSRRDGDDVPPALAGRAEHAIGLTLDIPIGDYGPRQAELNASTGLRTAELRYEDVMAAVEAQVLDAVQQVETMWLQLEAARRARDLAAQALDIQSEKLRVGRASNFEVLSFQETLRAADAQELSARIAYLNALTALDQQLGSTLDTWRISLND